MLFDEATSALDLETEQHLLQNILEHHQKTVIFITHRPAVVEYCDQTLKIEKMEACHFHDPATFHTLNPSIKHDDTFKGHK